MALRYLKEDWPELHVIAAGSLLELVLNDKNFSMPVGRVEYLTVHPLSFYEFLCACKKEKMVDYLRAYRLADVLQPSVHEHLLQQVQEYNVLRCEKLLTDVLLS
jgi:uncharacterized protein